MGAHYQLGWEEINKTLENSAPEVPTEALETLGGKL
jgi:ferredoxin-type protein NapG